ncbi:hypothetical protein J132_00979 [Termitomyces sp. J132]|nr:hypothetical protein J132_00979 [Termitomyces sp. J132]
MALDEALCLGLTWDPDICLRMESANSQVNTSVGLAKNVPFTFAEGFTLYLQVHIFVEPAYTVLLGCPFDTLTESNIQNLQDGSAIITSRDPNTGHQTALPTLQRGKVPKPVVVTGYTINHSGFKNQELRDVYLQAFAAEGDVRRRDEKTLAAYLNGQLCQIPEKLEEILVQQESLELEKGVGETAQVFSEKYKPVARKVKPVLGTSPEELPWVLKNISITPGLRDHPTLPLDLAEATWLVALPEGPLSTEELIGSCARALAKHHQHVEEI